MPAFQSPLCDRDGLVMIVHSYLPQKCVEVLSEERVRVLDCEHRGGNECLNVLDRQALPESPWRRLNAGHAQSLESILEHLSCAGIVGVCCHKILNKRPN